MPGYFAVQTIVGLSGLAVQILVWPPGWVPVPIVVRVDPPSDPPHAAAKIKNKAVPLVAQTLSLTRRA
jgi:hypothetical protein